MADVIISAPGQVAGTGDRLANFLKIFGGEVITAFERTSKTFNRHQSRTINAGKSAAFPCIGRATAQYLAPGKSLDDIRQNILQGEVNILIDGLLTADCLISDIDDAIAHYDVRQEYSRQLGEALGYACDGATLAEIAKMVVADAENVAGLGSPEIIPLTGSTGTDPISATLGALYTDALAKAKYYMDTNFVPEEERTAYVMPDVMAAMVNAKTVINNDYNGTGSIATGTVLMVHGFEIVQVPGLTRGGASVTNILQGDGHVFPTTYASTCKILTAHRTSVGTLKLKDLGMEHARRAEYQADQVIGKMAVGHKGLRPETVTMTTLTLS